MSWEEFLANRKPEAPAIATPRTRSAYEALDELLRCDKDFRLTYRGDIVRR